MLKLGVPISYSHGEETGSHTETVTLQFRLRRTHLVQLWEIKVIHRLHSV